MGLHHSPWASTNVSLEEDLDSNSGSTREDLCRSSDGEPEVEMLAQPALPYQFVETWWMPMGYGASPPSMCPATSTCFGQTMPLNLSSFVPMPWADHSMGVMDSHGVDADAEEWRTTVMIRNLPASTTLPTCQSTFSRRLGWGMPSSTLQLLPMLNFASTGLKVSPTGKFPAKRCALSRGAVRHRVLKHTLSDTRTAR